VLDVDDPEHRRLVDLARVDRLLAAGDDEQPVAVVARHRVHRAPADRGCGRTAWVVAGEVDEDDAVERRVDVRDPGP